jgi:hypothetical protein
VSIGSHWWRLHNPGGQLGSIVIEVDRFIAICEPERHPALLAADRQPDAVSIPRLLLMKVDHDATHIGVVTWHPCILRPRREARVAQVKPLRFSGTRSTSDRLKLIVGRKFRFKPQNQDRQREPMKKNLWRAVIEVSFIVFLFYSNLLMGEFERSGMGEKRGIVWAITNVFTVRSAGIALISAFAGYALFEFLRKRF